MVGVADLQTWRAPLHRAVSRPKSRKLPIAGLLTTATTGIERLGHFTNHILGDLLKGD